MKKNAKVLFLLVMSVFLSIRTTSAQQRDGTGAPERPRLLIVWYDGHGLYPDGHDGVAHAVASIFAPLDLEMRWQRATGAEPTLDDQTILLRIVLTPSDPSGPGWRLDGDVLGAAPAGNGRARSVYIFYKEIVREVSKTMPDAGMLSPPRKLVENALVRVVAHEMIHAIAPSVRHTERGLMRPSVGASFLAHNHLTVSSPVRRAFLAGAESILARSPGATMGPEKMPRPSDGPRVPHP